MTISDSYHDTGEPADSDNDGDGDQPGAAQQTYSGPNRPSSNDQVSINVDSSKCTYQILFGFDVPAKTTKSGSADFIFGSQTGKGTRRSPRTSRFRRTCT